MLNSSQKPAIQPPAPGAALRRSERRSIVAGNPAPLAQAIVAGFLPATPGKDGLPFPSRAISLTSKHAVWYKRGKTGEPLAVPGYTNIPTHLNVEQPHALTHIPPDLSDRGYYASTEKERELINRRRRASHCPGFAVYLALLKFPGRTLKEVPRAVLTVIAERVDVPASAVPSSGDRANTLYVHPDERRRECGFRSCGWREHLLGARSLLPDTLESNRPLPLIETALERLRAESMLVPNMISIERLVWIVLKIAARRFLHALTQPLTLEQRSRLDGLLHVDAGIRGATRLNCVQQAPGVTSPKSIKHLGERLSLPALPVTLHQNRVLQFAHIQQISGLAAGRSIAHAIAVTRCWWPDSALLIEKALPLNKEGRARSEEDQKFAS